MIGDLDLFGVFVPRLLVLGLVALVLNLLLKRLLARLGAYRLVWHPALFDLALFLVLVGGLNIAFDRYFA
ncbi:DUF1656 domain-containing protein [Aureimonas endophytica]|uniref:DUF1656 domain-containing protein n=1 Tax=Aureimonas endophytica TaxID=2027858 RepID=A0A916ZQB8_9HYPH|nr:DUF1656 domain-containing protein [Aureimonas endophytica]GGE08996.1 DUF1656 domain-containing protein [Aureimonas endophytica]